MVKNTKKKQLTKFYYIILEKFFIKVKRGVSFDPKFSYRG